MTENNNPTTSNPAPVVIPTEDGTCAFRKEDGTPCDKKALEGDTLCITHARLRNASVSILLCKWLCIGARFFVLRKF